MNLKENLEHALSCKKVEIKPIINTTQIGIMESMETDISWEKTHKNPEILAKIAAAPYELAGIECVTIPFSLAIESEAIGATTDFKNNEKVPKIKKNPFKTAEDIKIPEDFIEKEPVSAVLKSIEILEDEYPEVPIIVGNTGPFTLAGRLIGNNNVLKLIKTNPIETKEIIETCLDICMDYIEELEKHETDVICVTENLASPKFIDPLQFKTIVKPALEDLSEFIKTKSILQICGPTQDIISDMGNIGYDGINIGETIDLKHAKSELTPTKKHTCGCCTIKGHSHKSKLIGNISSSETLLKGSVEDVKIAVKKALDKDIDILAPSCGLLSKTPIANIKAMINARNEYYE